ncbi:MAG: hypothetical protein IKK80_06905 [Treponema sp.]|nr:hypothetical protein [Treponema sp.]
MNRGVSYKITYKPYNQDEQWLLPPSLDELVPQNHFVRIVSKTVDELEIEEIKEAAAKINERLAEINNLDDEETKEVKKTKKSKLDLLS